MSLGQGIRNGTFSHLQLLHISHCLQQELSFLFLRETGVSLPCLSCLSHSNLHTVIHPPSAHTVIHPLSAHTVIHTPSARTEIYPPSAHIVIHHAAISPLLAYTSLSLLTQLSLTAYTTTSCCLHSCPLLSILFPQFINELALETSSTVRRSNRQDTKATETLSNSLTSCSPLLTSRPLASAMTEFCCVCVYMCCWLCMHDTVCPSLQLSALLECPLHIITTQVQQS